MPSKRSLKINSIWDSKMLLSAFAAIDVKPIHAIKIWRYRYKGYIVLVHMMIHANESPLTDACGHPPCKQPPRATSK